MTTLDDTRWSEVERLFDLAIAQPREERHAWVAAHVPHDSLGQEVREMLAAHERVTGILDRAPVFHDADVRPRLERALGDRYTIVRSLGAGGSASVFLAREHKHDRPVVFKVLHPEIAVLVGVHRFLAEVRIAAQLSHPHILPLIDSGEVDGLLYYVMPHLEGETLRERLERVGRISIVEAVELLRDIASALQAAHAAGVVHRDLKPENVLCAGNHAYLIDFGIAVRDDVMDTRHTGEGMVIGTPGYMSPEQIAGQSVGPPSDIYAWGVIAQEMLTGVDPFATTRATMLGAPRWLATLVRRSLDPDPARRPTSAAIIVERLTTPRVQRWRASKRVAVAAVLASAMLGALALLARTPAGDVAGLPVPVAVAPLHNETGDSSLAIYGRMAADWLTQGLHETSLVRVVPWPTVRQAWETAERTGGAASIASVADEIGASTFVTGTYYRTANDRVGFRLDVTDTRTNALIVSLPPIIVPRDSLDAAIREARDRLMGFVALRYDERASALPDLAMRPPRFDAYRAFDRALELYNRQDYAAAATEFRQAWNADTTFAVPLIYAAMAHWNREEFEWVDTLVTMARGRRDRLSEYDQQQLDYVAALLASDGPRAVAAGQRAVEIAPESRAAYNLGRDLVAMDRAEEGRRVLEAIDPDRGLMKGWPSYWTQLTHARHLTADHERELEAARAMLERFPDSRVALVLEARALAALGRTAPLDSLLEHTATLPAAVYWSHGGALVVAGEELIVHHGSDRGVQYLERAVAWLRRELNTDPGRREHRYWLGSAYYDLGRWREADGVFSALHREFPDRFQYRGLAAVTRARGGDYQGAVALLGAPPEFARGEHTAFRARLAAIVGDTSTARALRTRSLQEITDGYAWMHASAFRDGF